MVKNNLFFNLEQQTWISSQNKKDFSFISPVDSSLNMMNKNNLLSFSSYTDKYTLFFYLRENLLVLKHVEEVNALILMSHHLYRTIGQSEWGLFYVNFHIYNLILQPTIKVEE